MEVLLGLVEVGAAVPLRSGWSKGFEGFALGDCVVEILYRFIRSSELPVARMRLLDCVLGERARQRIDEACAAKRKVSGKDTSAPSASL